MCEVDEVDEVENFVCVVGKAVWCVAFGVCVCVY